MYAPPPGLITDKTALLPSDKDKSDRDLEAEKFPFLKNAPVQGIYTENMKITHKPFGIELRNVKCARCGNWGHTSGDRECPMKDFNPNDSQRQKLEDPLTHIQSREMQLHKEKLILKNGGRSPIRGGMTENDPNQQMLPESESESSDAEREFLATLTPKQKKKLLKNTKNNKKRKRNKSVKKKLEAVVKNIIKNINIPVPTVAILVVIVKPIKRKRNVSVKKVIILIVKMRHANLKNQNLVVMHQKVNKAIM